MSERGSPQVFSPGSGLSVEAKTLFFREPSQESLVLRGKVQALEFFPSSGVSGIELESFFELVPRFFEEPSGLVDLAEVQVVKGVAVVEADGRPAVLFGFMESFLRPGEGRTQPRVVEGILWVYVYRPAEQIHSFP